MAVDSVQAGRRGLRWLPAVCAVLFGVFLMHGAPATAAEGCHGAMAAAGPMTSGHGAMAAAAPMTGGHGTAALLTAHAPTGHGPGPAVRAAGVPGMPGVLCVSTPAHERTPLPAPGLLAVAGAAVLALWTLTRLRATVGERGRRGPPGGGRDLLLQVCVART